MGSSTSKRGNKRRGKQGAESNLSSRHVICQVGSDQRSCDWASEEWWGDCRESREGKVVTGRVMTPMSRGQARRKCWIGELEYNWGGGTGCVLGGVWMRGW